MELLMGGPVADRVDRSTGRLLEGAPRPRLCVLVSGTDPSAMSYSRAKVRKGKVLGIDVELRDPGEMERGENIDWTLGQWWSEGFDAMVLERPLPAGMDTLGSSLVVPPLKDVEGMHPENQGLMLLGNPRFIPPTALGVLLMMGHYGIDTRGKRVAVVGRGPNVGRPLSILLSQRSPLGDATVTLLHSRSPELSSFLRGSDVIITAAGRNGMVNKGNVREGCTLIDVGMSEDPGTGKLKGDVDLEGLEGMDIRATPTPGGTGPVTVSAMFLNVARAVRMARGATCRTGDALLDLIYTCP